MINLTYVCTSGHESQGYFKDRDYFLKQLDASKLECLSCGKPAASEGLSKPQINNGTSRGRNNNLRAEAVFEDAGPKLYEKAMAIANGEMPLRPLIGKATNEQAQEIAAAGIDIIRIVSPDKSPRYDA